MKKTLTALAMASGLAGAAPAADQDVVQALYSEVLSGTTSPDLPARMARVLSPDWRSIGDYASPVKTRDQFLAQLLRVGGALPNLSWKVEEILQVGNRFVVRGRATATPVAPFMGAPFTGRSFEIMAIDIHTVEDHKIVLSYHVEDWHGAVEQLQRR
jgi:predicted ester cyclase